MTRRRTIRKGQIVLYQGEVTSSVFMIKQGIIRAYSILANGNEINVALFGRDDYFPIGVVAGQLPVAVFYYEALTDAEIEVVASDAILEILVSDPAEFERMTRRYLGALLHIQALGQDSAAAKLAQTLRYLALRFGGPVDGDGYRELDISLTQSDVARLANVSRETVSHELSALKNQQAVWQTGKRYRLHVGRLSQFSGDELQPDINLSTYPRSP